MDAPPYPEYKVSGIAWLGDIPIHWETTRVASVFTLRSGGTPSTSNPEYWNGTIPWVSAKDVKALILEDTEDHITPEGLSDSAARMVPSRCVLLVTRSGILRHTLPVTIPHQTVAINQDIKALLPADSIAAEYFAYTLEGNQEALLTLWRQQGATVESLDVDAVRGTAIPLPPLAEQHAIADFLDAQTVRIDTLVAKKRELIEKLKEKRTALISRTVTRGLPPEAARAAGLDPHPPLKPSGVEWLGDVPDRWRIKAFKRICTRVDVGIAEAATHAYSDDGVPIIRSTNVHAGFLDTSDLLKISEWFAEKNRSKTLHAGDLVTVRTGHPGTTAEIPPELDGSQCFTLVMSTLKASESPRYYCYLFNSKFGFNYFQAEGWGTAQTNISVPIVQEMSILEPPLIEQKAIADYLDYNTAKIDQLSAHVDAAIDRLQEYRTALITAAVTGKIDVRGAVTNADTAVPEAAA